MYNDDDNHYDYTGRNKGDEYYDPFIAQKSKQSKR